jgi:hypothetical protein
MIGDSTEKGFRRSRLLLWAILVGILAGALWIGLALHGGSATGPDDGAKGGRGMAPEGASRGVAATRPGIDTDTPQRVETATFALG